MNEIIELLKKSFVPSYKITELAEKNNLCISTRKIVMILESQGYLIAMEEGKSKMYTSYKIVGVQK